MDTKHPRLTFSQRNGLEPLPPQLKLGEVSNDMRRLAEHYIISAVSNETTEDRYGDIYFTQKGKNFAREFSVFFEKKRTNERILDCKEFLNNLSYCCQGLSYGKFFDLIEFFIAKKAFFPGLYPNLVKLFIETGSAYRITDEQVHAVGTGELAKAVERALEETEKHDVAAREHLIKSGKALAKSDWANSVRESIHAVESIARVLAPNTNGLGDALKRLEKNSYIHGALKKAFLELYGYTSDEQGVRHALVFEKEANVDEADALFMLGACASFVSYVLMKKGD